jgi:serine/threonine protein kinase
MEFSTKLNKCLTIDQILTFLAEPGGQASFDTDLASHFIHCPSCFAMLDELSGDNCGPDAGLDSSNQLVEESALLSTPAMVWDVFKNPWPEDVGFRIGSYEIIRKIDDGGMGEVFEGRDVRLNRRVALKTILRDKLSPQTLVRLSREAEILAALKHPNIVSILEFGEWRGLPFLVMEFVEGQTLADRIQKATLPPLKAALLLERVASAIHYAHEQGVLHRDLKPSNILIEEKGLAPDTSSITGPSRAGAADTLDWQPKVIDFGLSKWLPYESRISQSGGFLGTPEYMPPEQIDATQEIGPTADVYSMGVVLYECLVGQTPFKSESLEATLQKIREQDLLPLRMINPRLPRDLEVICLKCLRKEPSMRYQTAQELADDLKRYISGNPIHARPVGILEKTWQWSRRNRPLAAAWAFSVMLLAGLVASSILFGVRQNELRQSADSERQVSQNLKLKAEFDRNKITELYLNQLEMLNRNLLDLSVKEVADLKSLQVQAVQERSMKFLTEMKDQFAKIENEDLHQAFPKLQFDMIYHLGRLHKKMGDWPNMAKAFEELLEVSKTVDLPGSLPILLKISAANDVAIYYTSSNQGAEAEKLWMATWDEWKSLDQRELRKDPRLMLNLDSITSNLAMFLKQQNQAAKAEQILDEFQQLKKAVTSQ